VVTPTRFNSTPDKLACWYDRIDWLTVNQSASSNVVKSQVQVTSSQLRSTYQHALLTEPQPMVKDLATDQHPRVGGQGPACWFGGHSPARLVSQLLTWTVPLSSTNHLLSMTSTWLFDKSRFTFLQRLFTSCWRMSLRSLQ